MSRTSRVRSRRISRAREDSSAPRLSGSQTQTEPKSLLLRAGSRWTGSGRFAGEEVDVAVVEPEARAVPSEFDDRVRHIELADGQAFDHLELIDIPAEAAAHEPWSNETLTSVNGALVRLGVIEGDFHWHKHDDQDEFFLVLDGELLVEVEGSATITLSQHQACSVPKGVLHRTRAPRRTTILMVEAAGVMPVGD
jgi:mannose-6-phosphate isomerase-like protein (cupin superfamily)